MGIFTKYIDYIKDNPEGYWFKRKMYGWGWTPATKEGWGITLLYVATIIFLTARESDPIVLLGNFVIITILLWVIVFRTGEPPKWQWGNKNKKK